MNQFIPTVCALALLSGFASAQRVACYEKTTCYRRVPCCREDAIPKPLKRGPCCYDAYREPYRISYPRLCPAPEPCVITNTERALSIRQAAVIRQREIVRFEKDLLAATAPITQPSTATGTVIQGETEGAGVFDNPCAPIPTAYPGVPAIKTVRSVYVAPPVGECAPDLVPVAVWVTGKPGCVYSPFDSSHGVYIDVRGLAPGSLAKDPGTGRVFRVP